MPNLISDEKHNPDSYWVSKMGPKDIIALAIGFLAAIVILVIPWLTGVVHILKKLFS